MKHLPTGIVATSGKETSTFPPVVSTCIIPSVSVISNGLAVESTILNGKIKLFSAVVVIVSVVVCAESVGISPVLSDTPSSTHRPTGAFAFLYELGSITFVSSIFRVEFVIQTNTLSSFVTRIPSPFFLPPTLAFLRSSIVVFSSTKVCKVAT